MNHFNKKGIVPSNDTLSSLKRVYATHRDKPRAPILQDLSKTQDTSMRLSLQGQQLFGLQIE